jgi:NADPH:quinone reductase-like Zn-dependent oxidoreductase
MKAIQVRSFGPPEVLRLTELRDPGPGPGEVTIDVIHAVGLIDVFRRRGLCRDRPSPSQPPYVPRLEVAGTVPALGEGVAGFEVGEPAATVSANSVAGGSALAYQQNGNDGSQPGPPPVRPDDGLRHGHRRLVATFRRSFAFVSGRWWPSSCSAS